MGSRNVRGVRAGVPQGVVIGRPGTSKRAGAATYIGIKDLGTALVASGGVGSGSGVGSTAPDNQLKAIANDSILANISGASAIPTANTILAVLIYGQPYTYAAPTNGATETLAAGIRRCILDPAGTIAGCTVVLPPSPVDGQIIGISTTQVITTLTLTGGTGAATVSGAPSGLVVGQAFSLLYRATPNVWFICA